MRVNELRNVIGYLKDFKADPFLWEWKLNLAIGMLELNLQTAHQRLSNQAIPDMAKILVCMIRGGASDSQQYAEDCLRSIVDDHLRALGNTMETPEKAEGK